MSFCSSPPTAPRVSGRELFPQQTTDKTLQHGQHRHGGRPEGPCGSGPPVRQKQQREEGGRESEGGRGRGRAQDGRRGPELVLVLGCVMLQGAALEGPRPTFPVCSQCAPGVREAAAPICPPTRAGQPSSTLCPWNSGQGATRGPSDPELTSCTSPTPSV